MSAARRSKSSWCVCLCLCYDMSCVACALPFSVAEVPMSSIGCTEVTGMLSYVTRRGQKYMELEGCEPDDAST